MAISRATRYFFVNNGKENTKVDDPLPGGTILEVKKILSGRFPAITNSTVVGPKQESNGDVSYEFRTVAADKG